MKLLFALFLLLIFGACAQKPAGFYVEKITSHLPYHEEWDTGPLPAENVQLLSEVFLQPFYYLASGTQSYAFVSADQKYVLKFFKMQHLLPKNWLKYIPIPWLLDRYREKKIDKRVKRLQRVFGGYKMAYEELKQETGLVCIHLNKTTFLHQKVTLCNRNGETFSLNLDDLAFVLQRKVDLFSYRLHALLKNRELSLAKDALDQVYRLIATCSKKGFIDEDQVISSNYGFLDGRAVHFDIGRLVKDESIREPERYAQELERIRQHLFSWVIRHYPELESEFLTWRGSGKP